MASPPFLTRIQIRNYKSIGFCDVRVGPLTYLVGPNGAGKSNFLDALHLTRDAVTGTIENALRERGGFGEVHRRSSGHNPNNFSIKLWFALPEGAFGSYFFKIASTGGGGFVVQNEECQLHYTDQIAFFTVEKGRFTAFSEGTTPAISDDRLALVAVSGNPKFRPLFDTIQNMGFYNLNPKLMRELQKPQDGRLLKAAGENVASVIGHLERVSPINLQLIDDYLHYVVSTVESVRREKVGPMETLQFRQPMAGAKHPWTFSAQNMSDGTLRAVGVLTALFQRTEETGLNLVGIEEPETALHPAASAALREALTTASETTQVLVTSHSPELLDDPEIDPDSILAVEFIEGETCIGGIDEASKAVIHDKLFTVGELLRRNQITPNGTQVAEQKNNQTELFVSEPE